MVKSEIETTTDCKSESHFCTVCNKRLMVKAWWPAVAIALIISVPYLIVYGLDRLIPNPQDPPFCYREEKKGDTTKRIFVECSF